MTSTVEEREAFLWLQGRLVDLLLRHDVERFRGLFDERAADPAGVHAVWLRRYRDLAVLFYLRDELFDSILPRIKRRLSFAAPHAISIEEPPVAGRIDWARTAANWSDWPDHPPLQVHTRQRRRHFATPENLLAVVTILEYRWAVQTLFDLEVTHNLAQALRHPLNEIVDACDRELVFVQFAGLVSMCEQVVSGAADRSAADLEEQVRDNLLPGHNNAYDDLLEWRVRLQRLQLLDRTVDLDVQSMLGADPARDNYLYQLWLFYELGEMLQQQGRLVERSGDGRGIIFVWGSNDDQQVYRLQHDQTIPTCWSNAPGVRPDYYIERLARQTVRDGDQVVWRELGYVLDAKFYKPRDSARAPASPIKRMVADLQLTGERHGALLFAFQEHDGAMAPSADSPTDSDLSTLTAPAALYHVAPDHTTAHTVAPDIHVDIWRARPRPLSGEETVQRVWTAVLDRVHGALKARVDIRCHGVFLDQLSATAHGRLAAVEPLRQWTGRLLTEPLDDLLVCPKPHVAPWRVDLVSVSRDCCVNGALCHVKHLPGVRKPQRLTLLEEVAVALTQSVEAGDDDAVVQAATRQVQAIAQRYASLVQPDLSEYRHRVRDALQIDDLFDTTPLLSEGQRDTLALGRFLWEQIEHIKATNFAAAVLLFTGVLEELTRVTIYKVSPPLLDEMGKPLLNTLGTLGHCKGFGGSNWRRVEDAVLGGDHWNERVIDGQVYTLSAFVDTLKKISYTRNDAAHRALVEKKTFIKFVQAYFGSPINGLGVFNGLLLAWK